MCYRCAIDSLSSTVLGESGLKEPIRIFHKTNKKEENSMILQCAIYSQ